MEDALTKNQKKRARKRERMESKRAEGTLLTSTRKYRSPASTALSRSRFTAFILQERLRNKQQCNSKLRHRLRSDEAEAQGLRGALQDAKSTLGCLIDRPLYVCVRVLCSCQILDRVVRCMFAAFRQPSCHAAIFTAYV